MEEAYAELECDRPFYEHSGGGITISGGEPLAQHLFLLELLALCKAGRLHTALDTTACTRWPILESVLQYTDLVLLDLKVMDPARHREYTGLDNTLILENAQAMAGFIAARATHYSATGPQNTESDPYPRSLAQRHEQNLRATAAFVRETGGAVRRVNCSVTTSWGPNSSACAGRRNCPGSSPLRGRGWRNWRGCSGRS